MIISYEQFKRAVEREPGDRVEVGERAGLGRLQAIAFAARLAVERGEVDPAPPGSEGMRTH